VYGLIVVLALILGACLMVLLRVRQSVRLVSEEQDRQLRMLVSRSNELEATLGSMLDGVLAVSLDRRVVSLNEASANLLGGHHEAMRGGRVNEVIGHDGLALFVDQSLGSSEPIQDEMGFDVSGESRRYLAQGTVLRDRSGKRLGSLIVLRDVTVLRQLEVVRRDFVSNASHEIKTPVAAIKAAAETLVNAGACVNGDGGSLGQEELDRFLPMIVRQADRLGALVEDLLSLARIERDTEELGVTLEPGYLSGLLKNAVEVCQVNADGRRVGVLVDCDGDLCIPVNAPLIEQAVVNLVDNAIKYSPEGGVVRVGAARVGGEVVMSVTDEGPGVGKEHQERLFERFYRTDKARSRELGGTGLGLAIVKHIAVAHGGSVSLESEEGKGSTFRLHLPLR
jgi:two-component system phosphate regulon sensor histidine kinase PhoR